MTQSENRRRRKTGVGFHAEIVLCYVNIAGTFHSLEHVKCALIPEQTIAAYLKTRWTNSDCQQQSEGFILSIALKLKGVFLREPLAAISVCY